MTDQPPVHPGGEPQGPRPEFNPDAPHQQRPRLRPVRGFGARNGEQVLLGLADAQQISQKMVFTAPAAQAILPHLTGDNDLDTIVDRVGHGLQRQMLEQFVAQLDDAGLLFGPTFDELLAKMRSDFDSAPHLPPSTTAGFADLLVIQEHGQGATDEQKQSLGPEKMRRQFDAWIDQTLKDATNPSLDALPKAIVAPHIDFGRGWMNYAHVYGRMRVVDRPDRVVILGTNHFGNSTGVCVCDKGFETPLGLSEVDLDVLNGVRRRLGDENSKKMLENRYDHEREHSIEMQVAWIQHVFGADDNGAFPTVFAALVHDPSRNGGESYDGAGLALDPFVEALRETLVDLPGRTLVVCSADLSHVGPQFGDQQTLAGDDEKPKAFREKVLQHDRAMLELFANGKADEMVTAMAWQQNPTRWCSVGAMLATVRVVQPESVQLLHYAAAMDQQGTSLVSSCAAVMN